MDHQAFAQLLGNYGEFVGSIAVLATLIYLAFQIRQNTAQLASASLQAMADRMENKLLFVAGNRLFAEQAVRLLEEPESLTPAEMNQHAMYFACWVADLEEAYRQSIIGNIPTSALLSRIEVLKPSLDVPFLHEIWVQNIRPNLDPAFVQWVDPKLAPTARPA